MYFFNQLRQVIKQNEFLSLLYDKSKIIIQFYLFYIVREGLSEEEELLVKPKIAPCDVSFLYPSEMKAISANPEVPETEYDLLNRLSRGCQCIGAKHYNEIAAYMWCNLRECDDEILSFNLKEDEAYLMDARTFNSYKGKNLAPYLRVQLYRHLRQMGRTKFISIT